MINSTEILKNFKSKISSSVDMIEEGIDRFRIFTPFGFDDGDSFSIVLKKVNNTFLLTDEGNTYMHLSYDLDLKSLEKGKRAKLLSDILEYHDIKEFNGAFVKKVDSIDSLGNAFFNYIQALSKITDSSYYLSEDRVKSTFYEDFKTFLKTQVDKERVKFDYTIPSYDKQGKYPIDCMVNHMEVPLFIFGINNDDKCRDVTINLYQYEKWGVKFNALTIFEDQESINRKVLARLSDVTDKQFSSLSSNRERIVKYINERATPSV
jgi:hypothetical protein